MLWTLQILGISVIRRVTHAISIYLGHQYITAPTTETAVNSHVSTFFNAFAIPQCLGARLILIAAIFATCASPHFLDCVMNIIFAHHLRFSVNAVNAESYP